VKRTKWLEQESYFGADMEKMLRQPFSHCLNLFVLMVEKLIILQQMALIAHYIALLDIA